MGPLTHLRHAWAIGLLLLTRSIGAGENVSPVDAEEGNKELANVELKSSSDSILIRSGHALNISGKPYEEHTGSDLQGIRESKDLNEVLKSKIEAAVLSGLQDTRVSASASRSPEATARSWFKSEKEKKGSGDSRGQTHRVYLTGNAANRYKYAGTGGSAVQTPPRLVVVRDKSSGSHYHPPPEIILKGGGPTYENSDGTIVFESIGGGRGGSYKKGKGGYKEKDSYKVKMKGYQTSDDEHSHGGSKVTIVLADTHNHPPPSPVHSHVLYEDTHSHGIGHGHSYVIGHDIGHTHKVEDQSQDSGTSWVAMDNGKGIYGWGWDENNERGHVANGGLGGAIHHVLDHLESIDHHPDYGHGHYESGHSHGAVSGHVIKPIVVGSGHALGSSHVHVPAAAIANRPSHENHVHVIPSPVKVTQGHVHDYGHGHDHGHGHGHGYDYGHVHDYGHGKGKGHQYDHHEFEHDHLHGSMHHAKETLKHIYYGAKKAFLGDKGKGGVSIGDIIHVTVQGGHVHAQSPPHTHVPVVHTVPVTTRVPRITIASTTTVNDFHAHTYGLY